MSGGTSWSRFLISRLAVLPGQATGTGGRITMFGGGTGGMRKYLSSGGGPGLLSPTGGVASTASFFRSQHLAFHHQQKSCCQKCDMSTSSQRGGEGGGAEPELKAKLEEYKERLASNVYYGKYKEKFAKLEQTSPRELLAKLEELDSRSGKSKSSGSSKDTAATSKSKKSFSLRDVMEVGLLEDLARDDIIYLWQEFHRKKDGVLAAVMSGTVFERMESLAASHPVFVMPMPRTDGYEFFLVQYMEKTFHFTPLLVYQTHKENAPEVLRLINYTDLLQKSKDLVLMRGEFDPKIMKVEDAHVMAVQINFYYGEVSESRKKLLQTFTSSPDTFDHMQLIDELKSLQETHPHLFDFEEASSSSPSPTPS